MAARWPLAAFVLLCLCALAGFLLYPTYPTYDSYYSLLWGRELLDGQLPTFEAYRAPTQHPLAIALGALLSPLGHGAERVWVLLCVVSFVALVVGVYRLARHAFTPLVGVVAALLLLTRFDFAFYAARGYTDIAFMALVVWGAVLEARHRRRGTPVLVLLAVAGLLRPEAWLMAGLYFVWVAWPAPWRARLRYLALAAIGPALWALTDLAVTGNPLYSLQYTGSFAEELGRATGGEGLLPTLWLFLVKLDKLPVLIGGIAGLLLAFWLAPRRIGWPLILLAIGLTTFLAVGLGGFSVIDRYLLVTSLMVMVFCAFAVAGWTVLERGARSRRAWAIGAALLVVFAIVYTAARVKPERLYEELAFRGEAHESLHALLADPAVREGMRCGPISVPNHKLIPDVRWILDRPNGAVLARSDKKAARRVRRGVAIYVHGRNAVLRHAITGEFDDAAVQIPMAGFQRRAVSEYYTAYVRCS